MKSDNWKLLEMIYGNTMKLKQNERNSETQEHMKMKYGEIQKSINEIWKTWKAINEMYECVEMKYEIVKYMKFIYGQMGNSRNDLYQSM